MSMDMNDAELLQLQSWMHDLEEGRLDQAEMEKSFSLYLKKGLAPDELPDHFESIKQKIEAEVNL